MKMKMFINLIKILVLAVPAGFAYLGIKYSDSFYYLLSFISLVFWFFVLKPGVFSNKKLSVPKIKAPFLNINVPKIHEPEIIEWFEEKALGKKFSKRIHLPLIAIFLFSQLAFLYLGVFELPLTSDGNIIIAYFKAQLDQILVSWPYFLVGILFAVIVLVIYGLKRKLIVITKPRHFVNTWIKSLAVVLVVLALSLGLSFLSLYAVAVAHANSVKSTDVISGEKDVLQKLKNSSKAPKIVGVEKGLDVDKPRNLAKSVTVE